MDGIILIGVMAPNPRGKLMGKTLDSVIIHLLKLYLFHADNHFLPEYVSQQGFVHYRDPPGK